MEPRAGLDLHLAWGDSSDGWGGRGGVRGGGLHTHPLLPEEGWMGTEFDNEGGGGEGKQVGWGATDRLCHCLSAPPAVLSSLR